MRALVVAVPLALAFLAGASSSAAADAGADAGSPLGLPACVQVTTETRYIAYGYNHIVHVRNACAQAAACLVSTDVSPEPQRIDVMPTATADVTTFLGAVASTFVAKVTCTLH